MPDRKDIHYAILIVSGSEQFEAVVKRALPARCFTAIDVRRSATTARRCILERYYDIVVINAPLPDEPGISLALDIAEKSQASILIAAPAEVYEDVLDQVTDAGILAISKPMPHGRLGKALHLLIVFQSRLHRMAQKVEAAHEKMEEMRIVNRAKFLLMEQKHLTEEEAHRYIGKQAMNNGVSRKRIAQRILEDEE